VTLEHDLAATLRDLADVYRWDTHCGRDARSPMGHLVVPSYKADAVDAAPPPRLPDDGDGRDIDWTRAKALRAILVALPQSTQVVLWALCRDCPQGTATDAAARHVAREYLRATGCETTGRVWRMLEAAHQAEHDARNRAAAVGETAAIGRRRRVTASPEAAAKAAAARDALASARASRENAAAQWEARGRELLTMAVGEWRAARRGERMAA